MKILTYPHQILKTVATPVQKFNSDLVKITQQMFKIMYSNKGIGLAANQVGILQQIVVVDINNESTPHNPIVFINPKILEKKGIQDSEEGCLSLPNIRETITRAEEITLEYQDLQGMFHKLNADNMLAICLQHEIDHINGNVFIDHLPRLKRQLIQNRLKKHQKSF